MLLATMGVSVKANAQQQSSKINWADAIRRFGTITDANGKVIVEPSYTSIKKLYLEVVDPLMLDSDK